MASDRNEIDKDLERWKIHWNEGRAYWHKTDRNEFLVKYTDLIIGNGNDPITILFPLCGKCVDMKWFWENGHTVYGVECSEIAINEFFKENHIGFDVSKYSNLNNDESDDKIFQTKDKRLNIIQTNFFAIDSPLLNGKIEAVWDRGAMVAVTNDKQILYSKTIRKLLANEFRYLLQSIEYDNIHFKGPPYSTTAERINQLMGEFCNIEPLERSSRLKQQSEIPVELTDATYFLTPK